MSEPLVLGFETSCDETGVGIVRGHTLLADALATSMAEHERFGGVVPEIASRAHLEAMVPTVHRALADAGIPSVDEAPVIDGLTGLQRFFYSWARIWRSKSRPDYAELLLTVDPHSPAEFRCNAIVSNLDEFYEAFGVDAGDRLFLDRDRRVSIW